MSETWIKCSLVIPLRWVWESCQASVTLSVKWGWHCYVPHGVVARGRWVIYGKNSSQSLAYIQVYIELYKIVVIHISVLNSGAAFLPILPPSAIPRGIWDLPFVSGVVGWWWVPQAVEKDIVHVGRIGWWASWVSVLPKVAVISRRIPPQQGQPKEVPWRWRS